MGLSYQKDNPRFPKKAGDFSPAAINAILWLPYGNDEELLAVAFSLFTFLTANRVRDCIRIY